MNRPADIQVRSGELVALRLFDIAFATDLTKAEALWTEHARRDSRRSQLTKASPKAVAFDVPPLQLTLEPIELVLDEVRYAAHVSARLYDFGVVALAVKVPIRDLPWADFAAAFNALHRTLAPTAIWHEPLARVRGIVEPALTRPLASTLDEDYLFGIVHTLNEPLSADQLCERVDVAGLLSGESRPLASSERQELLQRRYSYFADDLVVLTWDRALIYEPRGDSDVADVIEVANAQLLEMRYYDELLDDELPNMYERVESARGTFSLVSSRRFANLARKLYTLVAEVTELTEKVDNALQVTEDVYLARIYTAALDVFRVSTVSHAVNRKLAIIRDTYAALHDEASSQRAEWLEVAIVVLIVIEIGLAILRH